MPDSGARTIGGMISTDAKTLRSYKFKNIKEYIVELEIMDGTGKLYTTRNVKDIIGTEGTVAIILKAKLKLVNPIKKTKTSIYYFGDKY